MKVAAIQMVSGTELDANLAQARQALAQAAAQGAELAVLVPAGQALPAPGDRVGLTFDPTMLHVMDEA